MLIHNAGITNHHTILTTPDHLLERIFALNTLAHYRLTKEFLPHMIGPNHGTIVTIASIAGFVTAPGMVDYCGTKAAAIAFHEGLTAGRALPAFFPVRPRTTGHCFCPPSFTQ